MKATTSPGAISGNTTERNVRPQEAPLTVETSSTSTLICCTKRVERTATVMYLPTNATIRDPHGGIDGNRHDQIKP